LGLRRKGEAGKVCWAARLRREIIMSLKWIANERRMGGWTCVANLLVERRKMLIVRTLAGRRNGLPGGCQWGRRVTPISCCATTGKQYDNIKSRPLHFIYDCPCHNKK
jgi:hypothetical protein